MCIVNEGGTRGWYTVSMEQLGELEARLVLLESKIDATYTSVEKMRKVIYWTGIVTVGVVVIPLVLIPLFLPAFFASQGLTGAGL